MKVVDASASEDFDAVAPVKLCLERLGAQLRAGFAKNLTHVVVVQRRRGEELNHVLSSVRTSVVKVRFIRSEAGICALHCWRSTVCMGTRTRATTITETPVLDHA